MSLRVVRDTVQEDTSGSTLPVVANKPPQMGPAEWHGMMTKLRHILDYPKFGARQTILTHIDASPKGWLTYRDIYGNIRHFSQLELRDAVRDLVDCGFIRITAREGVADYITLTPAGKAYNELKTLTR